MVSNPGYCPDCKESGWACRCGRSPLPYEPVVADQLIGEAAELRKIIAELGYCTPDASLEFMRLIPAEVKACAAIAQKRVNELEAALERIAATCEVVGSETDDGEVGVKTELSEWEMANIAAAALRQAQSTDVGGEG